MCWFFKPNKTALYFTLVFFFSAMLQNFLKDIFRLNTCIVTSWIFVIMLLSIIGGWTGNHFCCQVKNNNKNNFSRTKFLPQTQFYNLYIFAYWRCKPLIFEFTKYQSTSGSNDIVIKNSTLWQKLILFVLRPDLIYWNY